MRCDGTDDFMQIADNDNLDITKGFTITWFGELKANDRTYFASKSGEYHLYKSSVSNRIVFRLVDSIASSEQFCDWASSPITKDGLYFITVSFDGTYSLNSVKICINNIQASVEFSKLSSFVSFANKENPLLVMKGNVGEAGYSFSSGILFFVRLFNYVFTPSDVSYYWNNGRPDTIPVRTIDKYGSNTNKTPAQMKKGRIYKITNNTGSDFTLYGSPNN